MSGQSTPVDTAESSSVAIEARCAADAEAATLRQRIDKQREEAKSVKPVEEEVAHPAAPEGPAHPGDRQNVAVWRQIMRVLEFAIWFSWCCNLIHTTQWLFAPLYILNKRWFNRGMSFTKQQFGILIVTVTQWFCPTVIRISEDSSIKGQLHQTPDGRLETRFPERLILLANHQIYTEWLYLWWIAYTSKQHGAIYIILKESLKYIPTMGPAMMFYNFIFMARNWVSDKPRMARRLRQLRKAHGSAGTGSPGFDPMWLLIFPEGTNLSANTRKRSAAYAAKQNIQDLEHALLPKKTGTMFCLRELKGTVEWVYDCTIAYEGIPRGQYAQDLFTLRSTFIQGRPPKSVNMYWRRIHTSKIPYQDDVAFDKWLWSQWLQKESLLEHFAQHNRFPASEDGMPFIETEVKLASLFEIVQLFFVLLVAAVVLYFFLYLT